MANEKAGSEKSIVEALAVFQQACPAIKKDSTATGTKYTYKYGSLPHVLETIKPHMKKAGLTFSQPIIWVDGIQFISTRLYHVESGERMESRMMLPEYEFAQMNAIQSKGSVITYFRRYALMSILGIVAEEDDNDAQGQGKANSGSSRSAAKGSTKQGDKPWLNPKEGGKVNPIWTQAVKYLADGGTIEKVKTKYRISKANEEKILNDAMTFDDLPFDRQEAEQQEGDATGLPQTDIERGANKNFDAQGPSGRDFPDGFDASEADIY